MASPTMVKMLKPYLRGVPSLVDFGCGDGCYMDSFPDIPLKIGVDVVRQHDQPMVLASIQDACSMFNGWDTAILIDSIEHLSRNGGRYVINTLKHRFRQIIIFTPNGFWKQNGTEENPYQRHLSGWGEEDFEGFEIENVRCIGAAPESLFAVWRKKK